MDRIWLVGMTISQKFVGWWTDPNVGSETPWLTKDRTAAKAYTEAEALGVARALAYFERLESAQWMAAMNDIQFDKDL